MTLIVPSFYRRGPRLVVIVLIAGCSIMCNRTGSMPLDPSSDSAATAETRVADRYADEGGLEAQAGALRDARCECQIGIPAQPMGVDETAVRGEIVSRGWQVETLVPMCTERLLCFGEHHKALDQDRLERYWKRYRIVR